MRAPATANMVFVRAIETLPCHRRPRAVSNPLGVADALRVAELTVMEVAGSVVTAGASAVKKVCTAPEVVPNELDATT